MAQEGFWSPDPIDHIHAFLGRGISDKGGVLAHTYAFVRNLGYSLQYLQFLDYTLRETPLHFTVHTQTQKSFVITGMSLIEAILWYVLRKNNMHRTEEWEQVQELETRTFKEAEGDYRIINHVQRRLAAPVEAEMPLDAMIKRVESKKLLGLDIQVYKDLNYLRKLRNRVHIHAVQHDKDTDWWSFSEKEVKLMKKVLDSVLRTKLFSPEPQHEPLLAFLAVPEPADKLADDVPF
ncbi:MAG: hypothetical protein ACKVQU_06215 [Burkholderiales bacterium]